jgi:cell division protein FtsL
VPSESSTSELLYRRFLDYVEYEAIFGVQDLDAYIAAPASKFSTSTYVTMSLPEHSESFLGRLRYRFVVQILPKFGLTTNNSLQRAYAVYHDALQQVTQLTNSRDQIASMLRKTAEARDTLDAEFRALKTEQEAQSVQFEHIAKGELTKLREQVTILEASLNEQGDLLQKLQITLAERELTLRRAQQALTQRDQLLLEYQQLSLERDRAVNVLFKTLTSDINSISSEQS